MFYCLVPIKTRLVVSAKGYERFLSDDKCIQLVSITKRPVPAGLKLDSLTLRPPVYMDSAECYFIEYFHKPNPPLKPSKTLKT